MKKILLRGSLICSGILLGLIFSEIILRLFRPQAVFSSLPYDGPKCYLADPVLSARYRPNSVCHRKSTEFDIYAKINNLGFRGNDDIDLAHPKGKRVLFIGDSFTFGHGVKTEETFPEITKQILAKNNFNIEVINAGMEGSELSRYYLQIKSDAAKIEPELIIVSIYLGNDLAEQNYFEWINTDNKGLPTHIKNTINFIDTDGGNKQRSGPRLYQIKFLRDLHLFVFLYEAFFGKSQYTTQIAINGTPCYLDPKCNEVKPQIEKAGKLILGINQITSDNNAKLLIVIIPWEIQLPINLTQKSGVSIIVNEQKRHYLSNLLASFLKEKQIPYVNLLDAFENYKGEDRVFYPQDRHWTFAGHQITANAIAPIIYEMITK